MEHWNSHLQSRTCCLADPPPSAAFQQLFLQAFGRWKHAEIESQILSGNPKMAINRGTFFLPYPFFRPQCQFTGNEPAEYDFTLQQPKIQLMWKTHVFPRKWSSNVLVPLVYWRASNTFPSTELAMSSFFSDPSFGEVDYNRICWTYPRSWVKYGFFSAYHSAIRVDL